MSCRGHLNEELKFMPADLLSFLKNKFMLEVFLVGKLSNGLLGCLSI